MQDITIHHKDEHLMIVEKPAGLLTVPGRGVHKQDCLINRLKQKYPTALIVHRLDMATSGLLAIALNKKTHRLLSEMFAQRKVTKYYTALLYGIVIQQQGQVDLPLICDWPNRPKQKVDYINGKPAQTYYKVLANDKDGNTTRVELMPITGRSHQLRVHMLTIGHAIVGDKLYASSNDLENTSRLHLHASVLQFVHPVLDTEIKITSPAPF